MTVASTIPREDRIASWMSPGETRARLREPWPGGADPFNRYALVFGRFRFVLHSRELTADGVPAPVGNRALEVLSVLIEAGGELVSKGELLSRVWPTTTVEENNLQFQISSLRKALGEDRDAIKTVSGRGYRFVAETTFEYRGAAPKPHGRGPEVHASPVIRLREAPHPNNLPAPTSDIVGREAHLSTVATLVEANRLVTLVGAGGIGKTRLAIEVARRLSSTFEDGVWIAELAPLSDSALVLSAVASALGLGDASAERLAGALGSKRLLLVLDNCEHVIEAAAALAEALLHADARLHVIATSREPLRAEGEWVYRVPPLDLPPEGPIGLDEAPQYGATKLFIERIRAADPAYRFDARAAAAAAVICRRLDGIARDVARRRDPRRPDRRPTEPAHRGAADRTRTAPDFAGDAGLELRVADRTRAHAHAPPGRLHRRLHARCGGPCHGGRRDRGPGGCQNPGESGRQVARGRGPRRSGFALSPARDHARLLPGPTHRQRRVRSRRRSARWTARRWPRLSRATARRRAETAGRMQWNIR